MGDCVRSCDESIDTPLDAPLFWLDKIFKDNENEVVAMKVPL
jgi:hypothetical protein